jgi:hypothetical protein
MTESRNKRAFLCANRHVPCKRHPSISSQTPSPWPLFGPTVFSACPAQWAYTRASHSPRVVQKKKNRFWRVGTNRGDLGNAPIAISAVLPNVEKMREESGTCFRFQHWVKRKNATPDGLALQKCPIIFGIRHYVLRSGVGTGVCQ